MMRRLLFPADSTCALISGTVCLQEFISVSAGTSVPVEDQEFSFLHNFSFDYMCPCAGRVSWRQYIFRIRCIQLGLAAPVRITLSGVICVAALLYLQKCRKGREGYA